MCACGLLPCTAALLMTGTYMSCSCVQPVFAVPCMRSPCHGGCTFCEVRCINVTVSIFTVDSFPSLIASDLLCPFWPVLVRIKLLPLLAFRVLPEILFFLPLIFVLWIGFWIRWISWMQQTDDFCYLIQSANLCLLIGTLRPFTKRPHWALLLKILIYFHYCFLFPLMTITFPFWFNYSKYPTFKQVLFWENFYKWDSVVSLTKWVL